MRELFVALTTGVITGIYSGLVVARVARFAGLQNEAKRLVQALDWIEGDAVIEALTIKGMERVNAQLALISSELFFLRHLAAGDALNRVASEFIQIIGRRRIGENFGKRHSGWQKTIREMRPNWHTILSLRPHV